MLGGYCNVVLCFLGLVGNLLSLAVLFRKEMKQKNNTFNNLLIGKCTGEETSYLIHSYQILNNSSQLSRVQDTVTAEHLATSSIHFSGLVTFDSLHLVFGIMESFRSSFPSLYPDLLLLSFPWFHYPFYRVSE